MCLFGKYMWVDSISIIVTLQVASEVVEERTRRGWVRWRPWTWASGSPSGSWWRRCQHQGEWNVLGRPTFCKLDKLFSLKRSQLLFVLVSKGYLLVVTHLNLILKWFSRYTDHEVGILREMSWSRRPKQISSLK